MKNAPPNASKKSKFKLFSFPDILVAFLLILIFLGTGLCFANTDFGKPRVVVIENPDGVLKYTFGINREVEVKGLDGKVRVRFEKDGVQIVESSCDDKYCIRRGKISMPGQKIICAPNGITVSIKGETFVDSINY